MVDPATAGLKEGKKTSREGLSYPTPDSDVLLTPSFEKSLFKIYGTLVYQARSDGSILLLLCLASVGLVGFQKRTAEKAVRHNANVSGFLKTRFSGNRGHFRREEC